MKYKTDMMDFKELQRKATVNKFQRRLVWSENEKIAFIETLKRGYPFGSILIYKYSGQEDEKYSIVDGLQRYSTMVDFNESPHKYIQDMNRFIDDISNEIIDDDISENTKRNYKRHVETGINELFEVSKEDRNYNTLYTILSQDSLIRENVTPNSEYIYQKQSDLVKHVNEYLDVNDIKIPCIEFTGDETELANVFQNLNRGGKKLSKYQVFSAQWSQYTTILNKSNYNAQVLSIVIDRYVSLTDSRKVDILDFDEAEMRAKSEINLSEFCYAFGKLIIGEMDVFWNDSDSNEDLANEIGYSTLGIILSVSNNKLHEIPNKKEFFNSPDTIEVLIEKSLQIFRDINEHFKKYLKIPGRETKYESRVATNFQILSYFASIWELKYEYIPDQGKVIEKQGYKTEVSKNFKNFIYYYIFDIVTSRWSGTGDKKLNDIYMNNSRRYSYNRDVDDLEYEIVNWNRENLQKSSINFDNISKSLYVIYLSFYQNIHNQPSYDYEHIFPRSRFRDVYKKYGLSLGSIGNFMLLDSSTNRSKKDNHILGTLGNIAKLNDDFKSIHEYPDTKILKSLKSTLTEEDFTTINNEIEKRSKKLITNLMKKLSQSM